ncbi:MAG TPA: EamA family transporter, partial [Rhodopila sp.]|nr:EamA family transporter [Rhodopila sp.]
QAGIQGILSGVIAILLYGMAVTRLGAAGASAFVALVPGLATLMAIPVLGEHPSAAAIAGVLATSFGVALMTGVPAAGSAAFRRWFMPTASGRPLHDASPR